MALLMDNSGIEEIIDISASLDAIEDAFTQLGTRDATFRPRTDVITSRADCESIYFHDRAAGIQFAAVCSFAYERAPQRELGSRFHLEWFRQDTRDRPMIPIRSPIDR